MLTEGGCGDDDEVRTVGCHLPGLLEVCQECDDLDGLAEPHLVRQDAAQVLRVHHIQPVQTHHLVRHQLHPSITCINIKY